MTMLELSRIIFMETEFHALQIGLIITARTWSMAVAGLFFGLNADRFPRKPLFIFILLLAGLGRLLNGFAPVTVSERYIFFIVCNIFVGLGQGGLQPVVISYSNDAVEENLRSRFFGIYETFRQVFQILGLILAAYMYQIDLWREYFWLTGALMFICALFVIFVIKEPKRGAAKHELKTILANSNVHYKYNLTATTIRQTVFSKTNIMVFFEGIFTWIIFSIGIYLMYPYIQSEPYNISPLMTSMLMIIFGMPGAIFGSLIFAKISDKMAAKNIQSRINLIVFSIVALYLSILLIFIVPLPHMDSEQGASLGFLFSQTSYIGLGFLLFLVRGVLGIYHINQNPILQKINLPEAQGTISAWNQFLETIGNGLGPLIAGLLLEQNSSNYFITAFVALTIGLPAAFFWLFAKRWIEKDIQNVNDILKLRASELGRNFTSNSSQEKL